MFWNNPLPYVWHKQVCSPVKQVVPFHHRLFQWNHPIGKGHQYQTVPATTYSAPDEASFWFRPCLIWRYVCTDPDRVLQLHAGQQHGHWLTHPSSRRCACKVEGRWKPDGIRQHQQLWEVPVELDSRNKRLDQGAPHNCHHWADASSWSLGCLDGTVYLSAIRHPKMFCKTQTDKGPPVCQSLGESTSKWTRCWECKK